MIQAQIIIDVQGNNENHIVLNILEREDANDQEREMAQHIEDLFRSIFQQIQEEMGEGEVTITEIQG